MAATKRSADAAGPPAELLEARGLSKSFPGVRALDGVDFTVRRGEIHALMGENGAGKSTLIKLLTGVHARDAGGVRLDGLPIDPASPRQAEALGISTVYQEINLVPHLSVAENIGLGREPTRLGMIRWREVRRRARAALARLELDVDVARELGSCSIAVQQLVAIARAMDVRAKLLILDEPTSSLDADETAELFSVMRRLRDEGLGIIFVTHFLNQVYEVADRITVLRDGRRAGEFETAKLPRLELVGHMIGGQFSAERAAPPKAPVESDARPLLQTKDLSRRGSVERIDLSVGAREVVGLAGLLGSGRTEVARLLFGIDRATRGSVEIDGHPARIRSPRDAVRQGLAFTPENRKAEGVIPNLSVRENIILALQARQGALRRISHARQTQIADRFIAVLRIRTPSPATPVGRLSGGNQQKVLLARWLATDPKLLILDEPTRGIDIGARAEIERLIDELRGEGRGILLISSELEELVRACSRLVVLRDRRKVAELAGADVTEHAVMEAIAHHDD
ncbi:MAG: sugar ABC transporter ATP-binding protein [Planctomycetes bacterium]|nr:sugar ABC transporter ATP-binding protein [Planctomycetota bacterium]